MAAAADLRTHLLADVTVAGLIGTRMYPRVLPQGAALPAATYRVVSRTHAPSLGGVTTSGLCRIQIDVFASLEATATSVAEAMLSRLRSLSAGQQTIGAGTRVTDVEIEGPRGDAEPPVDGSDEWRYVQSLDALLSIG